MAKTTKKYIEDEAFKANLKFNVLEYKAIGYDTINENDLDTKKRVIYLNKIDTFLRRAKISQEERDLELQQFRLLDDMGERGALWTNTQERVEKHFDEMKILLDSVDHYSSLDSVLAKNIEKRKNPKPVYRLKWFTKAIVEQNGQTENVMDTVLFFFKPDLSIYTINWSP